MKTTRRTLLALAFVLFLTTASGQSPKESSALPSWNDTPRKKAILDFVAKVTTEGSPDFVPVAERIATFDNDGTLWVEQPMYTELTFAFDRVKALAPKHPDWKTTEPFKSVLKNDLKGILATGKKGLTETIVVTHTGMTIDDFRLTTKDWLGTAKHPRFDRLYTELYYVPMVEVMVYLRANHFKTYIVSGGTAEFMRPFTEKIYGVPPEQVVGTTFKSKFEVKDGRSALLIEPAVDLVDDGPGKPVGIGRFIGRRPIMAFGNSDGDYDMLQYTTSSVGPRFGLFVHHTDAEREYAYDRKSFVGKLDKGLDDAARNGWYLADMKKDWKVIFPKL